MTGKSTEAVRKWRAANPERNTANSRAHASRPEARARRKAQYRATHRPRAPSRFESDADRSRDWRQRNYARYLFTRLRASAKRRDIPFDLTPEFLEQIVAPMRCSVTGVELIIAPRGTRHALLPSIDQVVPRLGYLQSNVRLVSWIYNRAKGAGTDADVLDMALALVTQCVKQAQI